MIMSSLKRLLLTPLSDDPNDLEALTPNHILLRRPFTNPDIFALNKNQINNRAKWKIVQAFATMFWKPFVTEYIPSLTARKKWNISQRNFKIGDLVLVFDKNVDRMK